MPLKHCMHILASELDASVAQRADNDLVGGAICTRAGVLRKGPVL
jgi:hypothetical protein